MGSASQIRQSFREFFQRQEHHWAASAPVFSESDPTLLFTNAGMNQFKDFFLGTAKPSHRRVANTQKCLRVSGKHNDLEEVGRDTYHHTFFEMLGNWSFGDYFKREAIEWAWRYVREECGLPKERLWATVFGGDERLGLPPDEEAERLWHEVTDIAPEHVLRFGIKDNFWEMGKTGPCGPCSEIHIDRGGRESNPRDGANPKIGVNAGNERFIELWNLVFIQFNRVSGKDLADLPSHHVDTGMSLERLVCVLQASRSNYDTDLFAPIIHRLEELTGLSYGGTTAEKDVAFRVVADHARALTVAFTDGALPGNEGRGYVLRRLLRRAARFGHQVLGFKEPCIYRLAPVVADVLGDVFPELHERLDHVALLIKSEEESFGRTLERGLALFTRLADDVSGAGETAIAGDKAYDLYATYGFPRDLVSLMAEEKGLSVDSDGWERAEKAHREASKGSGVGQHVVDPSTLEGIEATQTLFYEDWSGDGVTATCRPLKVVDGRALVLDRSPFYPEAGGQVGDAGRVAAQGFEFRVDDTRKIGDVVIHVGELAEGDPQSLPGQARAEVDRNRRLGIMANHTGTHLLHWALRQVLGEHVCQQGSLVEADRLRFDFTHPRLVTSDELQQIEARVNEKVFENSSVTTTIESLESAKQRGVTALFGEKYGEEVRVVDVGGYSRELCGGTHCWATGQIGTFLITLESAVQVGVRRIEALTRGPAVDYLQRQRVTLREAARLLQAPQDELVERNESLKGQIRELKKGSRGADASQVTSTARALINGGQKIGEAILVVELVEGFDQASLKSLSDALRKSGKTVCGMVGCKDGHRALLVAFASKDLAGSKIDAQRVIKSVSGLIAGGGGGRAEFAQAGGKKLDGLPEAMQAAEQMFREHLASST